MAPHPANSLPRKKPVNVEALSLLLGLVLIVSPHIYRLPVWLGLTCIVLIVWRAACELEIVTTPNKTTLLILVIFLIVGISIDYYAVAGKDAGTALLIGLLCLKLHEIKGDRDIGVVSNMAIFTIVINFLYEQSFAIAIVMLVALLFLFSALIGYQHNHRPVSPDQTSRSSVINANERMHILLAGKMLLQAIPLAIVLFIFFPRIDGSLWGLPKDSHSASTGLTEKMSPGLISNLSDNDAIAFHVKFESNRPNANDLYWRGPVLWHFDGYSWTSPKASEPLGQNLGYDASAELSRYTITLQPHSHHWLFALDVPVEIPKSSILSSELQLLSPARITEMQRYQLASLTDRKIPAAGNTFVSYLQLPETSSPRSRQLVNELSVPGNPQATVNAVLAYFSENDFYYARNAPLLYEQPVDEFLFDTKRGYCEHFSSSFTVLMRLAGIPARIVTGYLGGQTNPIDGVMTVRQSDAHAWSEVYLGADKGWVKVDPTAYIPIANIENFEDARRLSATQLNPIALLHESWFVKSYRQVAYAWGMVNNQWNQWVLNYNKKRQQKLFTGLGMQNLSWKRLTQAMLIVLVVVTGLLATSILAKPTQQLNKVQIYYARFLKRFHKFGIYKGVSEGASEFCQRLTGKFPEKTSEITEISELYNRLRYGSGGSEEDFRTKTQSFRI